MWDNLGNVMDLSRSVFYSLSHPEHLKSLDDEYQVAKERRSKMLITNCIRIESFQNF